MALAANSFTVALSSTACRETFPGNTRSSFANVLPEQINNPSGKVFFVRPLAVLVGGRISSVHRPPTYLQLRLQELADQRYGRTTNRCAAEFPVDQAHLEKNGFYYHTFSNPVYLPLRFNSLTALHVKLTTSDGEDVRLADRIPNEKGDDYDVNATAVWFEFSSTMDEVKSGNFSITCTSSHPSYYPENTYARFTNPLHVHRHLEGYEVALQSIYFPPHLNEARYFVELRIDWGDRSFYVNLYPSFEKSLWTFLRGLNEMIHDGFKRDGEEEAPKIPLSLFRIPESAKTSKNEKYKENHGRVIMQMGKREGTKAADAMKKPPLNVTFNEAFIRVVGEPVGYIGRRSFDLKFGDTILFESRKPNVRDVIVDPVAALACNIVQQSVVGNGKMRLLHLVPLKFEQRVEDNRLYEPAELVYQPVEPVPFASIAFEFFDFRRGRRNFLYEEEEEDRGEMIIKLAFRKAKQQPGED